MAQGGCGGCGESGDSAAASKNHSKAMSKPRKTHSRKICAEDDDDDGILKIKHVIKSRPMNVNLLSLPKKRFALSNWKQNMEILHPEMLEQLQGLVRGRYHGININHCSQAIKIMRKKQEMARAAARAKAEDCSCHSSGTFVAKLLRKLKCVNNVPERKSLTCVIFQDICKTSGIDPSAEDDDRKVAAMLLSQKFGAWIDRMLEKKDKCVCNEKDLEIKKDVKILSQMFDCACLTNPKVIEKCGPNFPPPTVPEQEDKTVKKKGKGKGKGKKKKK